MDDKFKIILSASSISKRPPLSHKVIEYFEKFIYENILVQKKIILDTKWNISLLIFFCIETERYQSERIFLSKSPIVDTIDCVKIYELLIPMKLIDKEANHYKKTLDLLYEAIIMYFVNNYKRISNIYINELSAKIDFDYLLTLPYPAPLKEQKYFSDIITEEGNVKNMLAGFTGNE